MSIISPRRQIATNDILRQARLLAALIHSADYKAMTKKQRETIECHMGDVHAVLIHAVLQVAEVNLNVSVGRKS